MARQHYCGFCGKSGEDVERLLAGPCIEVCNECIDLMHKLVHERKLLLPIKTAQKPRTVIPFNNASRKGDYPAVDIRRKPFQNRPRQGGYQSE